MGESIKIDSQKKSGLTRQELRELEAKRKDRCTTSCRKGDPVLSKCLWGRSCFGVYADPGQQYEPESLYLSGISYIDDDPL